MSPASPSLPSSDSRPKWRKRKRRQKPQDEEEEEEDEEEEEEAEEQQHHGREPSPPPNNSDPGFESVSDPGFRVSDFPPAVRRSVARPHPSVLALAAAERFATVARPLPALENVSHGQLQALSAVPADHLTEQDKGSVTYVCTPPALMEGKGVVKRFGDGKLLLVPMHSDWFLPTSVYRLERQVVPHFFSGKSTGHTPEKYIALRNSIISRYLENPGRRLSFGDCQGLVSSSELYDLSRMVRFLDHWGIINYLAASSVHRGLRMAGSLIKEEGNGELIVQTAPLRSIDSLILFDRPKCSIRQEDIALLASSSGPLDSGGAADDLDNKIRERLSEHACSYCSRPLPRLHYQSRKEADTILCSECFHDAKFITGHSSIDFQRLDSRKDTLDLDGDSWTDQETLMLLEALEKYSDNWNEIAEHVGTKSKAQCMLHFLRLPMEDSLLENIEVPKTAMPSDSSKAHDLGFTCLNSNGDNSGGTLHSGDQLPFANSANPVMSLVAFLASAIGPRVAAACACASLAVLTKGDSRSSSDNMHSEVGPLGAHANLGHQKDEIVEDQSPYAKKDATSLLSPDAVKFAAMRGLSAAATKAKLFADQEEREVQRLAATIINHQLKRLELKLKQFAEVETLLLKECEQVERTRQRFSTERVRMAAARFGAMAGPTLPVAAGPTAAAVAAAAAAAMNANPRPSAMQASVVQTNITPASFGNSIPANAHPHMQFMQRQQMFGFGPRLPLSAIHPSPSPSQPSHNATIFNSGMPNASTSNHHPLLRSSSGNNSSIG